MDFPDGSVGKEFTCDAGGTGLIPGSGRSPGGGNCNPLQYSYLENPMDKGAWQATVHGSHKELDMTEHRHAHNLQMNETDECSVSLNIQYACRSG